MIRLTENVQEMYEMKVYDGHKKGEDSLEQYGEREKNYIFL